MGTVAGSTAGKCVLDLPVETIEVAIGGNKCSLTYLEAKPDAPYESKPQILLLHGARFTASTWNAECGTLAKLTEWGYRSVAVDLKPEAPISKCTGDRKEARAEVIHQLVDKLKLSKVVLVSPSKSGEFSIPYIMESAYKDEIAAYVPVAPVIDPSYTADDFSKLEQLKALVVQGENDHLLPKSKDLLMKLPNNPQLAIIAGAGHPCYLDNPDAWHEVLKAFLDSL